uniref:Uncharacterized protein n=1 Tax=Acrobeloides nanus TaxID=290746 RepID=A0A914DXY5_9BILA
MQPLEMLQMEQESPKAFHVPPSEIKRITDMLEDLEKSKIEVDTINRLFDEYAYCISGPKEDPLSMDSRKLLTDISTDLDLFAGDRIGALQDYLLKIRNENSSNSIVDCYASREEHRSKVIEKLQSPKIRIDTEKINYIKRLKGSGVIYLKKGQKLDKEIETLKCRHCYIFFGRFSLPGKEAKFDERRKNFDKLMQQNPTAFFVDLQMHKDLKEIFAKQNFYNLPSASQIGNQIWRYCINSNGKPELKNVDTNESRQSKVTNHSENNSNANCRIM